jgi:hypothetical protein
LGRKPTSAPCATGFTHIGVLRERVNGWCRAEEKEMNLETADACNSSLTLRYPFHWINQNWSGIWGEVLIDKSSIVTTAGGRNRLYNPAAVPENQIV